MRQTPAAMIRALILCVFALPVATAGLFAGAQSKGTPGKFDFYVLDMPWGAEFCSIKDVSQDCRPQPGFVLHGLWPQFNDGTWPVFCSGEKGPADIGRNLDLTPNLQLLQHEWDKHGTCSAAGPERFFGMARKAFRSVAVPAAFRNPDKDQAFTPEWIVRSFEFENLSFPAGSFVVSCRDGKLTAVEACFSRDLQPIACRGIHSCKAQVLQVEVVH